MEVIDARPGPGCRLPFLILTALVIVIGGGLAVSSMWYTCRIPQSHFNESSARSAMREAMMSQFRFRELSRAGTVPGGFWQGDWSGLYRVVGKDGKPVALIDPLLAGADAAPVAESTGGHPAIGPLLPKAPFKGYWFRALRKKRLLPKEEESEAVADEERFAFAAYPSEYGKSGTRTFVVSESGRIWGKDLGAGSGERLSDWPGATDDLTSQGWEALN